MINRTKSREFLKIVGILSLFFLFSPVFDASAQVQSFNRDLKVGDTGEDVRQLQKFLNSKPVTVVANSGPGSPGNETTYFGTLTKWAVATFQEQYKSEILIPNGLSSGTGFVGPATRAKLNSLSKNSNPIVMLPPNLPPAPPTQGSSGSASNSNEPSTFMRSLFSQKISLLNVSKYQVAPGGVITVSGVGLSHEDNFLHLGDTRTVPLIVPTIPVTAQVAVAGVTSLQATIPSDIPTGKYEVWVSKGENGFGNDSSKKIGVPFFISITSSPKDAPMITNVSPSPLTVSGEMIISGSGFTPAGNNIYSTLGNVSNVSSSGGNIVVRVSDFPAISQFKKQSATQIVEAEGWLYVQNDNGVNAAPAQFRIKF